MGIFETLLLGVGVLFLLGSLDDFFIDLEHIIRWPWLRPRRFSKDEWKQLQELPERRIAILIPAWRESLVLEPMVRTNLARVNYKNFRWFIGVYPNDLETLKVAKDLERKFAPYINVVVTDRPGPTSKGHCLNRILKALEDSRDIALKNGDGWVPEIIAIHDAEDVIHPESLKMVNFESENWEFVQIPVFSMPIPMRQLVAGTYCEEFAELHLKELPVRAALKMPVPSAGVGTFLKWNLLMRLREKYGYIFSENNLTEDYEVALRVAREGGIQRFLLCKDPKGQIIATREYFPDKFKNSVRQKTRWVTGIALQSAGTWGVWKYVIGSKLPDKWIAAYALYRDRRALWANPAVLLGWSLIAYVMFVHPYFQQISITLKHEDWIDTLYHVNLYFLFFRLFQRARFTWHVHGFKDALMTIFRMPLVNVINGLATFRAMRNFSRSESSHQKQKITWDKTDHKFPTQSEIDRT